MKNVGIRNITLSSMFIAIGIVLPFLTGQIPQIGSMLLPMHLPVFFCGLICGWKYGLGVGFVLPIIRSLLFGMPPLFPTGIAMAFELATYGFVAGWLYQNAKWQCVVSLVRCLVASMIAGRIVWAIVQIVLLGIGQDGFTVQMFISGAIVNALPGIILQLLLIPSVMVTLDKTHLVPFQKQTKKVVS